MEREIGVTVSIGLSHNKFLAKIASDLDKPRGFAVIGRAETLRFLAAQPVSVIWGVGKAMQERLARDGLTRIADLQKLDERDLAKRYGSIGIRLARLSRGEDDRSVMPEREAKSISAETTFDERPCRPRRAPADPAQAVGARLRAPEARGPCRPDRRAEAEDRRVPAAHPKRRGSTRRPTSPTASSAPAATCSQRSSTARGSG